MQNLLGTGMSKMVYACQKLLSDHNIQATQVKGYEIHTLPRTKTLPQSI